MRCIRKHRKPVALAMAGALAAVSLPVPAAQAELVGTERVLERKAETSRERVSAFLARDDVRAKLQSLGVSPDEAQARVDALSDAEVERIAGRLDTLPAGQGGFETLVGAGLIVFLVLLLTDVLGWTHVFGFTNKGAAAPAK